MTIQLLALSGSARSASYNLKLVRAMAAGALARSKADLAVSITGFAGPGDDDDEEGLVHFACATRDGPCDHRKEHFGAIGRAGVRIAALEVALAMMDNALHA